MRGLLLEQKGWHDDRKILEEHLNSEDRFTYLPDKVVAITGISPGTVVRWQSEGVVKVLLLINRNASRNKSYQLLQRLASNNGTTTTTFYSH